MLRHLGPKFIEKVPQADMESHDLRVFYTDRLRTEQHNGAG